MPPPWMSNCGPEQRDRHRRALDVPARAAHAPRRIPGRLAGLGALPEHEIERVALRLVDLDARAGAQVLELLAGELAVRREARDRVVDVAVRADVGVAARDQPADHRDDLGDVRGRARLVVRLLEADRGEVLVHRRDEARGERLDRLAALARAVDDLVVDVGDVAHVGDAVARGPEPAPRDVEGDLRARVADVDVVVDRDAAHVHADVARLERLERLLAAAHRVVDAKGHLRRLAAATPIRAGRAPAPAASPRAARRVPGRRAVP